MPLDPRPRKTKVGSMSLSGRSLHREHIAQTHRTAACTLAHKLRSRPDGRRPCSAQCHHIFALFPHSHCNICRLCMISTCTAWTTCNTRRRPTRPGCSRPLRRSACSLRSCHSHCNISRLCMISTCTAWSTCNPSRRPTRLGAH